MNKDLQAKIEEEADDWYQDENNLSDFHPINCYRAGTKSKALIEFLVPYVVELARKNTAIFIDSLKQEEILAKVWEEIK